MINGHNSAGQKKTENPSNKKFCGGPGGGFSKEPPGRRRQRLSAIILADGKSTRMKCLIPRIEDLLKQQTLKITELFPLARVKYIPLEDSGWFYNINTTGDYRNYLKGHTK